MNVDHISLTTTPINLRNGGNVVSQGTGFFYAVQNGEQNALFLVTNFHVLTGSPPVERKPPLGDSIEFSFHKSSGAPGDIKPITYPLFTKAGKPVWIQNRDHVEADVAIVPIPTSLYDGVTVKCISDEWATGNIKVRPTSPVTLVGYPYGFYDAQNQLPIWKTGSVASEPEVDFNGQPCFMVDVSAFPGMSGSPVFAISYGTYETEDGSVTVGGIRKFLGIYASMQMLNQEKYLEQIVHDVRYGIRDFESLELGQVWKSNLIVETIKAIDLHNYDMEILADLI